MLNFQQIKWGLMIAIVILLSVLIHRWNVEFDSPNISDNQHVSSGINIEPSETETASVSNISNQVIKTPGDVSFDALFHAVGPTISVITDVLKLKINLLGGNLVETGFLKYPENTNDKNPTVLFSKEENKFYIAQSGLVGTGISSNPIQFKTSQVTYEKLKGSPIKIDLYGKTANGLEITKQYILTPGSYLIRVNYFIKNNTGKPWTGAFYGQLLREPPKKQSLFSGYTSFTGGAYSSSSTHFEKLSFGHMADENLKETSETGWVSMIQHYFISAWIPDFQNQSGFLYSRKFQNQNIYALGIVNPGLTIPNGQQGQMGANLYVGPTLPDQLDAAAPYLNLTVDYGWLWFISELLFWVMVHIHLIFGNWGVAIIGLTILVKIIFYPLAAVSLHSMAKMRKLQPKIQALRQKYGADRQALGKATMALYQQEKVNPLAGCLPMLVQIPVFLALYWMLIASIELRQAPFIFWIKDLSLHDPYFILPVLMGLAMFAQQKLNPPPADPVQAKVMMLLPIMITFIFLWLPSGLVLYSLTNTCVTVAQQWYVLNKINKKS